MMIESIGYAYMYGESEKGVIDEVSYLIPRNDVFAQVSLGAVGCYDFPPHATYHERSLETLALVSIASYIALGKKISTGGSCLHIPNCECINFMLIVHHCQADATALIFLKAKKMPHHKLELPPSPPFVTAPAGTVKHVVHDALTGDIMHKHTAIALPGATMPSVAQIQQEVIDRASEIHGRPTSQLSVLLVKDGDLKPGFGYKVDVKKKTLMETKVLSKRLQFH